MYLSYLLNKHWINVWHTICTCQNVHHVHMQASSWNAFCHTIFHSKWKSFIRHSLNLAFMWCSTFIQIPPCVCLYMVQRWWEKTVATGAYFGLHLIAWASSNIELAWYVKCVRCARNFQSGTFISTLAQTENVLQTLHIYIYKGEKIALKHLMWHFDCFVDTVFINVSNEREVIENTFFLFLSNIRGKYNEK